MRRKALVTSLLVGAMLTLPATAALAHDCFIVNRSSQGALGAGHSGSWFVFDVGSLIAGTGVTNVDGALADWISQGYRAFYASRTDKVLASGTGADRNGLLGNGKGLDHFSQSPVFGALVQLIINWGGDPNLLGG